MILEEFLPAVSLVMKKNLFSSNASKKRFPAIAARTAGAAPLKNTRSIQASIVLFLYGSEVVIAPLASAATYVKQSTEQVSHAADEKIYLLYVAQQGESIAEVALRFAMSEQELKALRTQLAFPGWRDQVWLLPKKKEGEAVHYPGYVMHRLSKGESLASLALTRNRSERELARLNASAMGEAVVARLRAGDMVLLPALPAVDADVSKAGEQDFEKTVAQAAHTYGTMLGRDGKDAPAASDFLAQQAAAGASGALSQGIEGALSSYGRAKVGVTVGVETKEVDLALDYLHPLLEGNDDILFGQIGVRTFDERTIGNLGIGYRRQLSPELMVGANAFVDQDITRSHTRGGVGVEAWTNDVRLAANAYAPLSGWKSSNQDSLNTDPEKYDLYERPASGWDTRLEAALPGAPTLAATAKYFQWKGEGVDTFGDGNLERNPKGYGVGMKWQPIPLLAFNAEHQKVQGGDGQWQFGATLNWSFDADLESQLSASKATAIRPLEQARKDFVQREYNVVLDYKQKEKPSSVPFAFVQSEMVLEAPHLNVPEPLVVPSHELQGRQAGDVLVYSITTTRTRQASQVSIDPGTGYITVEPGANDHELTVSATQLHGEVVVGTASYALVVKSTIDSGATPIVDVTDITGTLSVGQTLTGVYSFDANGGDVNDASTLAWLNGGHTG
ncbi:MAG: inverse autotransporter beta domain-containing protein, partial [Pseudomonas sp.]|uniref:inverse autotransporter beta domain-containing protein n=1 Tax=Pseudomonas sp. TaxID=306 RepID=UPI003BB4FCF5